MKPKSTLRLFLLAAGSSLLAISSSSAASATWNGTTNAVWATGTNWSATPVPGTGDTATFNSAGGAVDVIDLGAGVTINSILFNTASVAAYTIGSGAVGSQTLNLNDGGDITLNNTIAQNQLINANVALGTGATITNNDTTESLTIAGGITGTGSNLTKAGAGTVVLSGLSTTPANNYTGTTILGGGTTTLTQSASFTGGLNFGTSSSDTAVSTLNLNSASATFAGPTVFQNNNTGSNNTITIGTGQKLTSNGDVTFNTPGVGNQTRLLVSGAGGWDVVSSNGTFGGIGTNNGNSFVIDMSALSQFSANLRTGGSGSDGGVFRIGQVSTTGTNGRNYTVTLATNSTISSDIVELAMGGAPGTAALSLGNGTQIINSDTIRMSTGSRESSEFNFSTTDGTLKVRGTDGGNATRSNLTLLTGTTTTGNVSSTFNVTDHSADLLFDTVRVYNSNVDTTNSGTLSYTATFSFDRGTLDATTFEIGRKAAGALRNESIAVANIGSSSNHTNTATLGTVNMGFLSSASGTSTATGILKPTLNITGTNTSVSFSSLSMANYTATDTDPTIVSAVNISGGTTTGTGGINMAAGDKNGITSTLNITGGSLSVGTSGVSSTNGIHRTTSGTAATTLILSGGSLNLNGNSIGGSGANAITTQFESGTLRDVGQINGGAGLTKTTAATLTISGTNTYTGATMVSAGTLLVTGALGNTAVSVGNATVGGTGTLGSSLVLGSDAKLDVTNGTIGLTSINILTVAGGISLTDFGFADIIGWDASTAAVGTYTLINGGGTVSFFGSTPTISNPFDIGGGKSGYFQSGSLQLVVIPEPSAAALLGTLGLLVLLRRRRN